MLLPSKLTFRVLSVSFTDSIIPISLLNTYLNIIETTAYRQEKNNIFLLRIQGDFKDSSAS